MCIDFNMKSSAFKAFLRSFKQFLKENKKCIQSTAVLFIAGFVIGIFITVNGVFGELSKVSVSATTFSGVKVFFVFSTGFIIAYAVLCLSSFSTLTSIISLGVFVVTGLCFGQCVCMLVAMYGVRGIFNLIIIYLPVYLVTFMCLTVAFARVLTISPCGPSRFSFIKPSIKVSLPIYGINVAVNFAFFMVIGIFVKVIVI